MNMNKIISRPAALKNSVILKKKLRKVLKKRTRMGNVQPLLKLRLEIISLKGRKFNLLVEV